MPARYRVSGEHGVLALVVLGLLHELLAEKDQLLSHAFDRWLETHPWLVRGVTVVTVLHLLNLLPKKADPYARIGDKKTA